MGVDNRALEIKKDIGLPVLLSNESELWSAQIKNEYKLKLAIPFDKIARWKNQFV